MVFSRHCDEDPHLLDVAEAGFLVNTGKQLFSSMWVTGGWWGGADSGAWGQPPQRSAHVGTVTSCCSRNFLRSRRRSDTQDGKRVFPTADDYVAKAASDFGVAGIACGRRRRRHSNLPERSKPSPRSTSRP